MSTSPFSGPRPRRIEMPARGGAVAALELGPEEGPVDVVFSHANTFNARTYRTILGPAAEELRILAYDLRGHGATELPTGIEGRRDWSDLAGDLVALLEVLDLRGVVLAGHSMGATITLMAAAEAADRVRAVALFEPVVIPPEMVNRPDAAQPRMTHAVEGALRRRRSFASPQSALETFLGRGVFKSWPREMVADYVRDGLRLRPDGSYDLACTPEWEAANYRAQVHDLRDAFQRAPRPIRILRGEFWSSADFGSEEERLAADGRVRIDTVPGTDHFMPMQRPDLVTETLLSLRP
jgi:pimeloyl-ACP methyl ester carboxylesterase